MFLFVLLLTLFTVTEKCEAHKHRKIIRTQPHHRLQQGRWHKSATNNVALAEETVAARISTKGLDFFSTIGHKIVHLFYWLLFYRFHFLYAY